MPMYKVHGCCAGFFSFFFILGICSLLFAGCNTNLEGQCIAYDVVEGSPTAKSSPPKDAKNVLDTINGAV